MVGPNISPLHADTRCLRTAGRKDCHRMDGQATTNSVKHISVCVCTYKRPQLLRRLLEGLSGQDMGGLFTYSIVIADNDQLRSAEPTVMEFAAISNVATKYCVETEQNIALTRNKAIENAHGDFVAFIDDDEEPSPDWLLQLVRANDFYRGDGVLGPVLPRFHEPPPDWIVRGRFFERPSCPTGTWLNWKQSRTGNVLLRKSIFDDANNRFRQEFGRGGEDSDFFKRMTVKGMRFVWCEEAAVHETVPPERCNRTYLLKRALLRGRIPYNQGWPVLKSLVAAPVYAIALPLLLFVGHHLFMRYLIKECDHLGRILAFLHIDVVRERYVS